MLHKIFTVVLITKDLLLQSSKIKMAKSLVGILTYHGQVQNHFINLNLEMVTHSYLHWTAKMFSKERTRNSLRSFIIHIPWFHLLWLYLSMIIAIQEEVHFKSLMINHIDTTICSQVTQMQQLQFKWYWANQQLYLTWANSHNGKLHIICILVTLHVLQLMSI